MFETKKTLIVVYKDELLMNQLKKMVETRDDNEGGIIGTKDNSINIVSWAEKVWLGNKKAGNIQGKILFLGNVKGTDKLIPVIDVKFDDCGVKYGWAGNQAVLFADPKALIEREDYDAFLKKLSEFPVPEFLKTMKNNITVENPEGGNADLVDDIEQSASASSEDAHEIKSANRKSDKNNKARIFSAAKNVISSGADVMGKVGSQVASKSEEIFRNKSFMKRQMLFYGVINLYNDGLEKFMNL